MSATSRALRGGQNSEGIVDDKYHTDDHAKSIDEERKSDGKVQSERQEESGEPDDELLKLLLDFGADPNARNAKGSTPLLLAAEVGHIKALRALLDDDADPNISNTGGTTALHRAAQSGHVACINLLVKKGANMNIAKVVNETSSEIWAITPLVLAISQGRLGAVKALVRLEADIGRAAHIAALSGKLDMFKARLS